MRKMRKGYIIQTQRDSQIRAQIIRVLERVHVWNSLNGLGIFDCQFDTASSHWEGNCIDQIGQLARLAG